MKRKIRINFLTLFLLFGVIYMGLNATMNLTKLVSYNIKLKKLEKLYNNALIQKTKLTSELEEYNSQKKYDDLARKYLGYTDPNTIKIILIKNNLYQSQQAENLKPKFISFAY